MNHMLNFKEVGIVLRKVWAFWYSYGLSEKLNEFEHVEREKEGERENLWVIMVSKSINFLGYLRICLTLMQMIC